MIICIFYSHWTANPIDVKSQKKKCCRRMFSVYRVLSSVTDESSFVTHCTVLCLSVSGDFMGLGRMCLQHSFSSRFLMNLLQNVVWLSHVFRLTRGNCAVLCVVYASYLTYLTDGLYC
jgi:hypothetical protein